MVQLSLNIDPFPEIQTERLQLRRLVYDDLEHYFELRSNTKVMRYIHRPRAKYLADAKQLIDAGDEIMVDGLGLKWAIADKKTNRLLGTIGYYRVQPEHRRGEIGYLLHPDWQGQGLMSEAMRATIQFGFENIKFHSIEARVDTRNEASWRLLERHHFRREAHFHQDVYFNGKFLDTYVYGLLNDWVTIGAQ